MRSISNRLKTIEKKLSDDSAGKVEVYHFRNECDDPPTESFRIERDGKSIEMLHSKKEFTEKYGDNYKVAMSIIVEPLTDANIDEA